MPGEQDLAELAALLNASTRTTLFCGRGCAGAHDALMSLAEALKSPIVHALGGKEFVEYDNPYDVGMTGLIGFASGYEAMMNADTVLMLGTDFPYRQFYPDNAKIAQVDIRPENIGRRTRIDLGLVGDVAATIKALLPRLKPKTDRGHLDDCLAAYRKARAGLDDLATGKPGRKPIHPQYLASLVSKHAAEDAVFTCDVGTPTIWLARYIKMNGKRRIVGSFAHGSMANAMMQAIGAQAAFPKRQIVSLSGDGGFTMMMGDFLTLGAAEAAGEGDRLQQRRARLRRHGDEGLGFPRERRVAGEPGFRGHGAGGRCAWRAGRGSGGTRGGRRGCPRP